VSLRKKILLVLSAITVSLLVILNGISWVFIKSNYQRLEREDVRNQLSSAMKVFSSKLDYMETVLIDWANWDDTYSFIQDRNQNYITTNLGDATLELLGIDMMTYLNGSGQVIMTVASKGEIYPSIAEDLRSYLSDQPEQAVKGVMVLPEISLLVAAQPILISKGQSPARGTLVMGRYLNAAEEASLSQLCDKQLAFQPINTADDLPREYREARTMLLSGQDTYCKPLDAQHIAAYALIDDIQSNPALIIKIETSRDIYKDGVAMMTYLSIFLFGACLIFGLAAWLLLEKLVIRRVAALDGDITAISMTGGRETRIDVEGKDEISHLEGSINTMLEKVELSEMRFRNVIENASDLVLIINEDGAIIYESPSIRTILGYETGELLGCLAIHIIHEDDVKQGVQGWLNLLASPGGRESLEIRLMHKDASWRRFEAIGYNLLHDSAVGGVVINARDITERHQLNERLEKLNEVFLDQGTNFQENAIRIVVACRDILGVPLAVYYRVIDGKSYMLPASPSIKGFMMADPAREKAAFDIIERNLRNPVIVDDMAAEEDDGLSRLATDLGAKTLLACPVVLQKNTVGCLAAFDLEGKVFSSQEIKTMGTLAHALRLEEERLAQERGLKDFIDVASHELRHPITLMKGYALTLRDFGERMDKESQYKYLTIIDQAANRLNELIKELLDISRIEQGRFTLRKENAVLEDLLRRAVTEMAGKGFAGRFSLAVADDFGTRRVDVEKLIQVLVILLDNALLHSHDEALVDVVGEVENGAARISVMDRGVGVPEEDRELIFERFFQVEDAIHHQAPGIGLGLYLARKIVDAHGGRIWYEPRQGGGSIFRFTIP
jgi:PAS domain S-box-containing protein